MPDQVRYIVYKVITAACNRPELGWPGTEPKISNQMIRHVVVYLNIDGTNSAKKDFSWCLPTLFKKMEKKSISFDTIPTSYKYIILNPLRAKCFKALG